MKILIRVLKAALWAGIGGAIVHGVHKARKGPADLNDVFDEALVGRR